jgi:hypothetical protein
MTIQPLFATRSHDATDALLPLCRELLTLLAETQQAFDEEIRAYPTPIPRCDAQFNHLYEERARLVPLMLRLRAAAERDDAPEALADAVAEFLASAPFTRSEGERDLRRRLGARGAS